MGSHVPAPPPSGKTHSLPGPHTGSAQGSPSATWARHVPASHHESRHPRSSRSQGSPARGSRRQRPSTQLVPGMQIVSVDLYNRNAMFAGDASVLSQNSAPSSALM
jgi:hypothetical protein